METVTSNSSPEEELRAENAELRARLEEAVETLRAIRSGEVEALIVETDQDPQSFSLKGLDAESNRFRGEVLAQVSDSVIAIDASKRVTYLNAAAERQYRVFASDALGRQLNEIYTQRWPHAETEAAMWTALREHGEWRGEIIHCAHDGREIAVEKNVTALRDASGAPDGYVGVFRDITERKLTESRMREQEERQRFAMQAAGAGSWDWEIGVGDIVWSKENYALYDLDPALGSPTYADWESRVHPDDLARTNAMVRDVVEGKAPHFRAEFRVVHRDGRTLWLLGLGRVQRDASGTAIHLSGINLDITERKQAEQTLSISEHRMRLAMEAAAIGMWDWDVVTGAIIWTPECFAIHGLREGEFDGTVAGFDRLIHPDDRDRVWAEVHAAVDRREKYECEFRIVRPDGEVRWVKNVGRALVVGEERPCRMIGTITDVTADKNQEGELAAREAHLRRVIDNQLGLVGLIDRDGILLEVDQRSLAIAKARREQVIGKHFADAPWWNYDPEVAGQMRDAMRRAFAGEVVRYDVSLFAHGAEGVMINFMIAPVFGADGEVEFLIPSGVDIRERYAAEQKLRESEERFRVLSDNIPQLAWIADAGTDGKIHWFNKSWLDYTGTTIEQMAGSGWHSVHHPDHAAHVIEKFRRHVRERRDWEDTFPLRGKDGQFRWFLSRMNCLRDESGKVERIFGTNTDITAQRVAEEELRKSEQRLTLGTEVAELALAEVDYTTGLNLLTVRAAQIFGLGDAAMAVPRDVFHATFHPEDREELERRIAQCLDPAGPGWFAMEHRVVWPGGEVRWVSVRKQVFFTGEGAARRPAMAVMAARDVTAEKTAAEALRESETRFRVLATAMPQLVWLCSSEGECTFQGPQWETATGQSLADSAGYGWLEMIHPEDSERTGKIWQKAVAESRNYEAEYRLRTKEGSYRWFLARAERLTDFPGAVQHWIGTSTDIDDAKQMAAVAKENEQRTRLATEATAVGIWEWNVLTNVIRWDAQMFRLYGIPPTADGAVQYSDWSGAVVPVDLEETERILQETARRGGQSRREFRIRRRDDGTVRDIEAVDTVRTNEHGQIEWVLGTNLDITERKQNQAALVAAKEGAEAASRAKDNFLAALSHELRTPLNPVLMTVTSLANDPSLPPEAREQLGMMRRNIELEARLIDDLLDITRISHGKLIMVRLSTDVHELLHHSEEIVRSDDMGKQLNVVMKLEAARHHAMADPARIQQVLWNLLRNAVKFTPDGGTITVSTRNDAEGRINISVADSGIGISAEALAKIFNAFEQGDTSGEHRYGGLGLGLAISSAIVNAHGGDIKAESEGNGHGAVFTVTLSSVAAPAAAVEKNPTPSEPARGLSVLIVEDHESSRMVLEHLLTRGGHRVTTASTLHDALTAFNTTHFDVVISDLGLPDGSGIDLMVQIQSIRPVAAIALSGYGMEDDLQRSKEAGFFAHLVKPVKVDRLKQLLSQIAAEDGQHYI